MVCSATIINVLRTFRHANDVSFAAHDHANYFCFSLIKSCPTLRPHGLQHAGLPCPSLSPEVCSNSCSLSRWHHITIASSVVHFSSCLQSFPALGSFPISWLFTSGGQSIGASTSVVLMNIQGWFPLGLTGLISLQSKGLSSLLQNHDSKALILWCSALFIVGLFHPYMIIGKTVALTIRTFVGKVISLLFNMLSRFVIAFLPRKAPMF